MSDTCIVCLGDLSTGTSDTAIAFAKSPNEDGDPERPPSQDTEHAPTSTTNHNETETNLIAHLQPCGHDLHNECLTPWVERANSCPICRQNFHLVELVETVGGPVISSYKVEDRTQIAEFDPSLFLELPDDEDEDQPCQACGEGDNEDVLMYCDGCERMWHTYCVDLQEVPFGHWFCDQCRVQRGRDPRLTSARRARLARQRTRAQQRRQRGEQQQSHDSGWTQVWQSVWDRIHIDLDFPHDDDEDAAKHLRRLHSHHQINRQAHEAFRLRMQVAELHGAGRRFRETEHALLDGHPSIPTPRARRPSPVPTTETPDEMMAWDAFDQARATSTESSTTRKKGKSISSSPTEQGETKRRKSSTASLVEQHRNKKRKSSTSPPVEQEKKKKRKSSISSPAEQERQPSSSPIKRRRVSESSVRPRPSHTIDRNSSNRTRPSPRTSPLSRQPFATDTGPSFLSSLLQEVEDSSTASHNLHLHRPLPRNVASPPAEQHSPRPLSPALSPLPSNHSSPRAMSATPPPPSGLVRPSSPTGLSSSIQPVFPSTNYSPLRSSPEPRDSSSDLNYPELNGHKSRITPILAHPRAKNRIPRLHENSSVPNRPRSHDTSPTRGATLSLSAKADVQKLVSAALKPHYSDQTISKDEYTIINRDISRSLYDKIGDLEAMSLEGRAKWEKVAGDEVSKAIVTLKRQAVAVRSS